MLAGLVLLVYYAPVVVLYLVRLGDDSPDASRGLARLTMGGVVPMVIALGLQYLG